MKAALVLTLCVGVLLPAVARADLEPGTYAPDIEAGDWYNTKELYGSEVDEPVSLSELRGMVVVLYFWVTYHAGGEYFMPLINIVENSDRLGRRNGVFLMGVTESDRERVEEMVKENRLLFPIALESKAAEEFEITSFPRVVVIDPNGKVAFTGLFGQNDENNFISKILDVIADTPPTRTHPREAREVYHNLDRARELIRAGEFKSAYHAALNAYDAALTGDPLKTECQDMLDLLEALGREKLATAMMHIDARRFEDGVTVLRHVWQNFRGMKSGRTAKKRLDTLEERQPDVKLVLEKLEREAIARGLLVSARDALYDRSFGEAYETLEGITTDYSDTGVVANAREIMARMKKNQAIMGYVRDHQAERDCNNWLGQARSFIRVRNYKKAEELLKKVIDEHPNTVYAEEAYRMRADLPTGP